MKFRTALVGGLIAAELCLSAAFGLGMPNASQPGSGKAFVTQTNIASTSTTTEYDANFGDNWESVRTFRLLKPLDKALKVYIETRPRNAGLYKAHYRDYALESLQRWSNALDGRLSFTLTNKRKEADITLDWVPGFEDRFVAGVTNYSVGHAEVEIKTVSVPDKDIKCNIMHEIGHALGISGHSRNQDDIMVGMRKWRRDNVSYDPKLSRRDIQAIRRLYSAQWKKGEDLYANAAQSAPLADTAALANSAVKPVAARSAVTLKPFDDTGLLSRQASQVRQAAPQYKYIQILPAKR